MFAPGAVAGVAVSGGADSVALLLLFEELKATLGFVCSWSTSITSLGRRIGLRREVCPQSCRGARLDSSPALKTWRSCAGERLNLEDAGAGFAINSSPACQKACHAHCSGAHGGRSGRDGARANGSRNRSGRLGGIYPVTEAVVRPLLQVRRDELRAFLLAASNMREDSTNGDVSRFGPAFEAA